MEWFYIIVIIVILICLPPFRGFVGDLKDRFSAWHLNRLMKTYDSNEEVKSRKKELFSSMKEVLQKTGDGWVLEIGCGSGPNVGFYPPNTKLATCDLNDYFKPYLLKNLEKTEVKLEKYLIGNAQDMEEIVPDASCSCVVSTLLLCCVDQEKLLREVMRVLKPGGRFYFMEHLIEKPGTFTRLFQILITPVWKRLRFNCHLDRDTNVVLSNFGFENFKADIWYRPTPMQYFFARRTYIGFGDKAV